MENYNFGGSKLPLPLSSEEEAQLFKTLKDPKTQETLITRNLRLVVFIAKKFHYTRIPIEDLISIGSIGLMKAVSTFEPKKQIKLATYANRCIENEILMYLKKNKKHIHNIIFFDDPLNNNLDGNQLLVKDILPDNKSEISFHACENRELISSLLNFILNGLSYKETLAILYRLGEKTQEETANIMGMSQSYISRLQKKIISKLHHFSENPRTQKEKDLIFSIENESFYCIKFSKEIFPNFVKILDENRSFPSGIKYENDDSESIIAKFPIGDDAFIDMADLIRDLKYCN